MFILSRFPHTLAGLAIGLMLPTGSALATDMLSPQQISEQLVGKTLVGRNHLSENKPSWPVVLQFKPDGTMALDVRTNKEIWTDTGRWHLSDTGYCVTWAKYKSGQEQCNTVQRQGDTYRTYRTIHADGSPSMELRVQ